MPMHPIEFAVNAFCIALMLWAFGLAFGVL